ncbi:hypothetical protein POTOM_003659 [Populus tomentosa]|uniref:Uncharacterized protein n=1 Tax=Populus tomentosa TaxID=118781 RepID=A0A8X8AIT9_POPTO|nr:hypothetical protein POTOM_003659 [Populus tomentosa]
MIRSRKPAVGDSNKTLKPAVGDSNKTFPSETLITVSNLRMLGDLVSQRGWIYIQLDTFGLSPSALAAFLHSFTRHEDGRNCLSAVSGSLLIQCYLSNLDRIHAHLC